MATAVHGAGEAHHEGHGLDYATRIKRARLGVLLLVLSDASFILDIIASHVYLRALNVSGQFHPSNEAGPSVGVGLIITILTVLSAAAYFWGAYRFDASRGMARLRTGVLVAWVLSLVALVGQIGLLASLRYPAPTHAYGSIMVLLTGYHAVHLILSVIVGFLLFGRITRNRIAGHEYILDGAGYWWFYVAAAAVVVWVFTTLVK